MKIITPVSGKNRIYKPGDEAAFALEFKDPANLHRLAAMGVIKLAVRGVAAPAKVAKVAKKRAPRKRAPRKK